MRFKVGQKVVCTNKDGWETAKPNWFQRRGWMSKDTKGPKFNDVVTVSGYDPDTLLGYYVTLEEWPSADDSFDEQSFEPLISDAELKKALESIEFVNANQ